MWRLFAVCLVACGAAPTSPDAGALESQRFGGNGTCPAGPGVSLQLAIPVQMAYTATLIPMQQIPDLRLSQIVFRPFTSPSPVHMEGVHLEQWDDPVSLQPLRASIVLAQTYDTSSPSSIDSITLHSWSTHSCLSIRVDSIR